MGLELDKLQKFAEAPDAGQMLIYTRQKVVFKSYSQKVEVEDVFADSEVLEVHLFDREKEYRAVATRSKRYENGFIEAVIVAGEEQDVYEEIVKTSNGKMKVINMINYQETGMINIDNYRLVMEV